MPERLIAVLDGARMGMTRLPLYSLLFLCRVESGEINLHPLEASDAGWFRPENLPRPLIGYERWGSHVFSILDGEDLPVLYDTIRDPIWRGEESS